MAFNRWDLTRSERKIQELAVVLADIGRRPLLVVSHNSPDPDTIASAWGLQFLLKKRFGTRSALGYGGVVTRAENKAMIHRLRIEMKQLSKQDLSAYRHVALVDAQPGTGNNLVDARGGPPLIIIDHHPLRKQSVRSPFHDIRPRYGSTSTIIVELLLAAGITPSRSIANALLYGLKTDTNSLLRGAHEADFHAFNYLSPLTNPRVLAWIERPGLPPEYFTDYHRGLSQAHLYRDVAISYLGMIKSEAIVPELADVLLRVEGVHWSLCMGQTGDLMIISLRSTARKLAAGRVMRRLVHGYGAAGGHREMAGGQVPIQGLTGTEVEDLAQKLIEKFLGLINRQTVHPRPLV